MQKTLTISIALLALLAASGAAQGSSVQTFFLAANSDMNFITTETPPISGPQDIKDGQALWFFAEYPAGSAQSFGTGTFHYQIALSNFPTGTFKVGVGFGDGTPTSSQMIFSENITFNPGQNYYVGHIPVTAFTVPAGKFFTFVVENNKDFDPSPSARPGASVPNSKMSLLVDMNSKFTPPVNSTPYPTPELGTLALAGAGVGLVAVAAIARRK